jgi:hypothetical protein
MTLATGSVRAPFSERGNDLYETPACAVESLLRVESIPDIIWEPACWESTVEYPTNLIEIVDTAV